jgi:hypothetical protein
VYEVIIEILVDLAADIIGYIIPELAPKTKFEKNITRLKEEAWFASLEEDYRYGYIIYQNRTVKRFLGNNNNIKMILSMDEEKEKFIRLVKEEHEKFTKLG